MSDKTVTPKASTRKLAETILTGFGLTLTELAEIMDVSRKTVHVWVSGEWEATDEDYEQLTLMFNLYDKLTKAGVTRPKLALNSPIYPKRQSANDLLRKGNWEAEKDTQTLIDEMLARAPKVDPEDMG